MSWIDAATQPQDLEHHCHDHLELRERQKGAGTAYAYQCKLCGLAKGGEVSKRVVNGPVPAFDAQLFPRYERKRIELAECNRLADVARAATPVQQINARIEQFFGELAQEFGPGQTASGVQAYLKRQRQRHTDSRPSRWESEEQLSEWLRHYLAPDFEITAEVAGCGYVQGIKHNIRLDFLIRPKQHLIEHGFADQYIGVEVKFFDYTSGHDFLNKSAKGFFQAISYWYSNPEWYPQGETAPVNLACVLLFSNLSFETERQHLFGSYNQGYQALWSAYASIAAQAGAGELIILDHGRRHSGWLVQFRQAKYFAKNRTGGYSLGNPRLINRIRIGNAGRKH